MTDEPREYIVIRLPKPRHGERFLWGLIVLVLIGLVFWNPFIGYGSSGEDVSAAATQKLSAEVVNEPVIESVIETEPVVEPVKEPEPVVEPESEPVVESEPSSPSLSGLLNFDVVDIVVNKPSDASYVKVKGVKYKIDNQKQDYNFLIKVKAFEDSDTEISKEKIRGEFNLPLKAGKVFESVVELSSGTWQVGDTISVVVILEDFDTGEVLSQRKSQHKLG
jgi:hypothetical protein